MTFTNSATLYTKYLKIQAAKIDLETAGEKAEDICEHIQELAYYRDTTITWCDAVEYAIGATIEYINLCVFLCGKFGDGRTFIIPDVISVVAELCDLKHSISGRKGCDKRRKELLEQILEAICDAGTSIKIQEEKYWLCISKLFKLDDGDETQKRLDFDIELIASREPIDNDDDEEQENVPKEESTIEYEALQVLKEAMSLPNPFISTSWVQRRFGYGYGKSARLLDWLEQKRYVQSYVDMQAEGLHSRRILASKEMFNKK